MKTNVWLCLLALLSTVAMAQSPSGKSDTTPGFDISAMDTSVDPCTDFYTYACGGWRARNPIPADRSGWGRFNELQERNNGILRGLLEQAAAGKTGRSADEQKIGDYYGSCMDEKEVESRGAKPIQAELERIANLKSMSELPTLLARLHQAGVNAVFRTESEQDFKDATQVIAVTDQGGLSLPDRDYYLKDDAKFAEIRQQYVAHVQKMFELLGETPQQAASSARTVMAMETALAEVSLERVKRREPANIYHKMTLAELAALSPSYSWAEYLKAAGVPPVDSLNVRVPDFVRGIEAQLKSRDLAEWKTYLRWKVLTASSILLSAAFVDENFDFFGHKLTGAKENRPRWKRCVEYVDNDLGEALGKLYVEKTFGAEGKARMLQMVHALESALGKDIQELPWMTEATKKQAMVKLHSIANKIGYPDEWRDYSRLVIARDDLVGNSTRSNAFEFQRQLEKIGKPVDTKEWLMTPPTVNAYYDPQMNNINFP
ncbi:MAG: M13 family metallopeptidase, partial [Terriglobales bacterium]